jgi:peptide/nickel transport system substrate-binding protein
LTSHGVAEILFTVDMDDEIVGQVAESVSKVSDLVWDVTLKSGYKFSDGTVVNAQHVADCLTELNVLNPSAQSSLGNMTVTAVDDLTVRIESDRQTHVMDAVLAEWVFVVYLKDANGNFVFTGPFVIETFCEDQIDLVPNPYYPDTADSTTQLPATTTSSSGEQQSTVSPRPRGRVTIKKSADGDALADTLANHEIDIAFHLPVERLAELRDTDGVHVKSFEVGYHYMMHHNLDTLNDVRVRQAIDIAIDRMALSQTLAGGTGTRSLFPDYSPYYLDDSDPHGDASAAAALLDQAGWALNATSGQRENANGTALTIRLVAYPHRPDLPKMQPVIAASLTDLGMVVTSILTGDDWDETQTIMDERSFDLLLWAQHTLPAGDPLWFLSSFFRSDGGSNHANFQSDTVDFLIDQLSVSEQYAVRVNATAVAHQAILDEVPVSNLVTPFWHVGLSDRMVEYEPWGSDYYVIRADLLLPPAADPTQEGDVESADSSGSPTESESSSGAASHIIVLGPSTMMTLSCLMIILALVL